MSVNYQNIFAQVQMYIDMMSSPPFEEGQIEELTERWVENMLPNGLDNEVLVRLVNDLSEQLVISQDYGNTIVDKQHEPWWSDFKQNNSDAHYWPRFEIHLRKKGELPPQPMKQLNDITDDIVDLMGNPNKDVGLRRGMVIGHVQSGKTLNYSSVICKAADAGFKIIILLTGTTNSLREQTQKRINEAFIGRMASQHVALQRQKVGVGTVVPNPLFPEYGTNLESDFATSVFQAISGFNFTNRQVPLIFVCKKHVTVLGNLFEYFDLYQTGSRLDFPLLLIDDEADNASINTRKELEEITKTNNGIRQILRKFKRSSYVGYTATPFANIFIDPGDEEDLNADDLFPANFIRTLDAPDNYMGAHKIFSPGAEFFYRMVVPVEDWDSEEFFPRPHKNFHDVQGLPDSLRTAIMHFILAKAVRVLRGDTTAHCTMMINVSLYNSVQNEVEAKVWELIDEIENDIAVNAHAKTISPSSVLHELRAEYTSEYVQKEDCGRYTYPRWNDVRKSLFNEWTVDVRKVQGGTGGIDYDKYKDEGYTVIAIGGLTLSRGLTLEGLCSTYITRNARAYDTLMQMGRWFGYRKNYEDLCRLYTDKQSIDHYQDTAEAIDELRDEIKVMQQAKLTPRQFGLKVRQSPHALRVTAANKMRTAEEHLVNIGYGGKTVEGHTVFNDEVINQKNIKIAKALLLSLGEPGPVGNHNVEGTMLWRQVIYSDILDFLKKFELPARNVPLASITKNGDSLVSDFIFAKRGELKFWNVQLNNIVIKENEEKLSGEAYFTEEIFPNKNMVLRKRTGSVDGELYKASNNRKIGTGDDARVGLSEEVYRTLTSSGFDAQNSLIKRQDTFVPTLILYFIQPSTDYKNFVPPANLADGLVSFVIHFPDYRSLKIVEKRYQTNLIWQQLDMLDNTEDLDAEMANLDGNAGVS
ncbi:Z1 domain-containing protein [Alphaproteobacteria bacterium]|nr:Z1 domain-containing protein [Alphaproteobacteria bacterium]